MNWSVCYTIALQKWEWKGLEEGLKNMGLLVSEKVEKGAEDEHVRNEEAREASRSAEEKEKKQ